MCTYYIYNIYIYIPNDYIWFWGFWGPLSLLVGEIPSSPAASPIHTSHPPGFKVPATHPYLQLCHAVKPHAMARSYRLNKFHHQTLEGGELPWKVVSYLGRWRVTLEGPAKQDLYNGQWWHPRTWAYVVLNRSKTTKLNHQQPIHSEMSGKKARWADSPESTDITISEKEKNIWTKITFISACRTCCSVGYFALTTSGIFNHRNMESPKISKRTTNPCNKQTELILL